MPFSRCFASSDSSPSIRVMILGNSAAMQVWSIGTLPVPGHKYSTGKVSAASCCRIQVVLPLPGGPATAVIVG